MHFPVILDIELFMTEPSNLNAPLLQFASPVAAAAETAQPWNILVVDDDETVHIVTKLTLRGFRFRDRPLRLICVHSARAARVALQEESDLALALVDVMMETRTAGLDLVRAIRDDFKNLSIRLILRTGQAGHAPEQDVVSAYEIDAYLAKTELSAQKLMTTITASLRTYEYITAIQNLNAGLEDQVSQRTAQLEKAYRKLHDANEELEETYRALGAQQNELTRFLAVASHDLRQPMHALNLYLGALANIELPERARPLLGNVRQCAQTMDDMFLALLDLSRLDAQAVQPDIEIFPISVLLKRLEIEFVPQAKEKGLKLRVMPCRALVKSDAALIERVLRNFAANAVRYTNSGTILIGCRWKGQQLRLAVFDTGPGISPEQQKTVFEEFYQVGGVGRDRSKGLGLGLAIVRRLGRILATPITLVSSPGRGSMFAIDLPRVDGELPVKAEIAPNKATLGSLVDKFVVVVDDEAPIVDAMRVLLEQWGCTVLIAASGNEALEKLASCAQLPDILVCDYRLRGHENGLDVIKVLWDEFNHEIPALLITGDTAPDRIQETVLSALPVLHKPVQADVLYQALLRLVANN